MKRCILAVCLCVSAILPAFASSSEAWEEFRADVEQKCLATATDLEEPSTWVDPFGTESYGIAILTGMSKSEGKRRSLVCVYDKRTKTVEITSGVEPRVLMPER